MVVAGMQQRDMKMVLGVLSGVSLGAMVAMTKEHIKGRDTSDWSAGKLFREGWDRSGYSGVYGVGLNLLLQPFNEDTAKFSQNTAKNLFGGPTTTLMGTAMDVYKGGTELDAETTLKSAVKMTPLLNSMHFRDVFINPLIEDLRL